MKELAETRSRLNSLRKKVFFPPWKKAYADALLEKAEDFSAVGKPELAEVLRCRLETWMLRQQSRKNRSPKKERDTGSPFEKLWEKEYLQGEISSLLGKLHSSPELFPGGDSQRVEKEAAALGKQLEEESGVGRVRRVLLRLRERMVRRTQRSLRARSEPTWESLRNESGVGLYNSKKVLSDLLGHIGTSDPIWTADFFETYGGLFRLEERILPKEKTSQRKRRR